jgi:hypothetical protein
MVAAENRIIARADENRPFERERSLKSPHGGLAESRFSVIRRVRSPRRHRLVVARRIRAADNRIGYWEARGL